MGVIFAIVFIIALFVLGIIGVVVGIIGIVVNEKKKKFDTHSNVLTAVFAVILSISAVVTIIVTCFAVSFFSFIIIMNSMPPGDFVKTEIEIEENGYQDTRFTADGVVYEALDFFVCDEDKITDPIFYYETKGFLNGSLCGNYYAIENSQGFHLVSDEGGLLFCPVGEKAQVIAYYTDTDNLCGYYDDFEGRSFGLFDDEMGSIYDFLDEKIEYLPEKEIVLDKVEQFEIKLICEENIVYVKSHWFLILNGDLYYIEELEFDDDDGMEYTLILLPDEISQPLLDIHNN